MANLMRFFMTMPRNSSMETLLHCASQKEYDKRHQLPTLPIKTPQKNTWRFLPQVHDLFSTLPDYPTNSSGDTLFSIGHTYRTLWPSRADGHLSNSEQDNNQSYPICESSDVNICPTSNRQNERNLNLKPNEEPISEPPLLIP